MNEVGEKKMVDGVELLVMLAVLEVAEVKEVGEKKMVDGVELLVMLAVLEVAEVKEEVVK